MVVLIIVFGATLVAQAITLGVLGSVSGAPTTTNTPCVFQFWIFNVGCGGTQEAPNPQAANAQALAGELIPWFIVFDAIFALAIVYLVVRAVAGPGRHSGGQIGARGGSRSRSRRIGSGHPAAGRRR